MIKIFFLDVNPIITVIMKNNIRRFSYLLLALALAVSGAVVLWNNVIPKDKGEFLDCTTSAQTSNSGVDVRMSMRMHFKFDNHGVIVLDGVLRNEARESFNFSRNVQFDYKRTNDSAIILSNIKMNKSVSDNAPDLLFDTLVWDPNRKEVKLYVKKMQNGYIFSNYISPMFICVQSAV
jgi:hypothetical protein